MMTDAIAYINSTGAPAKPKGDRKEGGIASPGSPFEWLHGHDSSVGLRNADANGAPDDVEDEEDLKDQLRARS
ncbi:hypothetical protein LTR37_011265 [Vermiconidia calcicola]|uniref:Uncharacterized protein n=1 Tax=Vermiconidia calcicola TaxID=1690605 RepID=A0ACC3N2U0_9PEZI|nr:hypothetical protein LTR37_011265 [Vermiconidia calcicola]